LEKLVQGISLFGSIRDQLKSGDITLDDLSTVLKYKKQFLNLLEIHKGVNDKTPGKSSKLFQEVINIREQEQQYFIKMKEELGVFKDFCRYIDNGESLLCPFCYFPGIYILNNQVI
jgi:hypothetical protein